MKRFLSIFLAIFALSLAACTNSEEVDDNNSQGGGNEEPVRTELTVSATTLLFDDKEDVQTIDIYASDPWTAEFVNDRAGEWCSIAPQNGQAGDSSILVSVADNDSGEERSASILIKAKALQKVVKVTQKHRDALTVTSSKFEVGDEGGEVEIEVKANVDYDYTIDPDAADWIKYKTTRAMESSTLVFEVAENPVNKKREAQITFKSGSLKEVVTIYQEGTTYAIILTKNEYVVSDKGETIAVEVKSNVDVAVEIPSDVDWVKENSTRAMSTNTYYFEVSPNEDYDPRATEIKFTNKANDLSETVHITQVQKDAIVVAKNSYTIDYIGGEIDIEVGHNVDFDIEISDNWITKTSTRAFETETLTFAVAANSSENNREGEIKFISRDKAVTQIVKVLQLGKQPNNEIWYTSTDGKLVTPYKTDAFGANIVSNTYENGIGVIKFDGDVTKIGDYAFYASYNSSSLTSITIPDSVTEIGDWAFSGCTNLTSITIPESVTEIGEAAFGRCSSLTAFYGKFASADNRCLIIDGVLNSFAPANLTSYTIPDSVTEIGNYAFAGCSSLASITIPDSVTEIGNYAFVHCSSLTSITIPDSVTEIRENAFYECSSLTNITIPNSVTKVGVAAFNRCSSLKAFYGKFASADNRCLIVDGTLNAFAIGCGATSYTIPDSVTVIGGSAFCECSSLTNITIPDSVTEIGGSAFYECSSLTSITIPDSVITIGGYAFRYCSSLTSVIIPDSVTKIEDCAFSECSSLTSVTIPDSVTTIGYAAFIYCSSLTSITIPDSVTEIENYAFAECSSLTSVTIGNSVTEIGEGAFHDCSSLTDITIPNSVITIGALAFSGCSSLTSITIPDSVTTIGAVAFNYCRSLTSVYCKPTTPPTADKTGYSTWEAFNYNASSRKIYVPAESVAAYKAADSWKDYADAIVGYDF